jgi:phosphoesterase RecJ-like protein
MGKTSSQTQIGDMIPKQLLDAVRREIQQHQNFIITTHVNPDGDGLGSQAALARYLRSPRGGKKTVHLLNSNPTPPNYAFLDPHGDMEIFDARRHEHVVRDAQVVFILDISDWERLRDVGKIIRTSNLHKICIDHHPAERSFGDIDIIYPAASSTGELMYELLVAFGATIDQKTAEALYTALLTDTGGFRFSNTNPHTHEVVARLIEAGASPQAIYQNVYECQSRAKVRLFAKALAGLNFEAEGRLAWFAISQNTLRETGAQPRDAEGFADYPRSIDGVEVSLMFLETEKGNVKVSFRSKGQYVINGLANRFGGGGHAFAAGALMEGPLFQALGLVLNETKELFNH